MKAKSSQEFITIKGARVNNLKNISLKIPKHALTVITGLSGSGKSSLAFDTIYAEGQRRYAESLNAYARQFMELQDKPDVDEITGLSPTIAIDQKNSTQNPRSTVGTTTEIYDHLRLLFARLGTQYCPETGEKVVTHTPGQIIETIRKKMRNSTKVVIVAPVFKEQHIEGKLLIKQLEQAGAHAVRVNGIEMKLSGLKSYQFNTTYTYDIDAVIETIDQKNKQLLANAITKALDLGNGSVTIIQDETDEETYSTFPFCRASGRRFDPIEPRTFSFNSPYGACPRCTGLGYTLEVDPELVIPNPRLTLAEGAIQPWTRIVGNQAAYMKLLQAVAATHDFSVDTPVKDLPKKVMDILLYGTDGTKYQIDGKEVHFEGIIPNLTARHSDTDSEYIKKEIQEYMRETICPLCTGRRLKLDSLHVRIGDFSIADVVEMSAGEILELFQNTIKQTGKTKLSLEEGQEKIAAQVCKEIVKRSDDLVKVGLYYLTMNRSMATLSGGESQRVRLSTQLSTGLTNVIYILDEPSIGLHSKDNQTLINTLKTIRDLGNTVIVVEHDEAMMEAADYLIDIGPGAGAYGGEIVAEGLPAAVKKNKKSLTGAYLSQREWIAVPKNTHKGSKHTIDIVGAKAFNLRNIDVSIPLGKLVCVTGVSGSGKSTLIIDILSKALSKHFYRAKAEPGEHKTIRGLNHIDKVISIDQSPIGRTPRSNPATYTSVFTAIRDLFTNVPEAKMRNYDAGMFSFNVKGGGRCEACAGEGYVRIPMQFLTDVFVECNECQGKRYNKEALEIHYRGTSISQVLDMAVEDAFRFFRDVPVIADKLQILRDVGLGYVKLGQPATTLSGGEAQRIKLATELARRSTGKTLYILDEPTTGLHFDDIKRLLEVLTQLVDKGNTVLIIEHNLDVVKCSDWVIDMGPDGGKGGGLVVAEGTPKDIAKVKSSHTGQYLKKLL